MQEIEIKTDLVKLDIGLIKLLQATLHETLV